MIGQHLAHYEILSLIGEGGMGQVWRARDTKLGREVAIKTLPAEFAEDAERLARFEREAKLLASLNHPNIAAIHGFEEDNGTHFLVLELVEGDTLADRLTRGAIPVEESLRLALQIAEALEAAHEKGVIHRDLKPANIKVTADDKVKVLDFGLAKAFVGDDAAVNASNSPTLSMQATQQGVILGTAAYMSPEQAKGRSLDERTDVWAFGCVLYEMLTGTRTFQGEDAADTLGAVLAKEVTWQPLPSNLHPRVTELLERCLERQPRSRYRGINDVRVDIEKVLADPAGVIVQPASEADQVGATPQSRLPWVLLAVAITIIAALVGFGVRAFGPVQPLPIARFVMSGATDEPIITLSGPAGLVISPDGGTIAYRVAGDNAADIYVRRIGEASGRYLNPVSEGGLSLISFSSDGEWIAYTSQEEDASIRRIPVAGGPSVRITESSGSLPLGGTWGADDTIVFANDNPAEGLMRVPAGGGEPVALTTPEDGRDHLWPELLPGGNAVLFAIGSIGSDSSAWDIAVLDLETSEQKILIQGGTRPRYVSSGHIVYGAEGALRAMAFDLETLEVSGTPAPVVENVASAIPTGKFEYDIALDGTLVYASGVEGEAATQRRLVWVDREGNEEAIGTDPRGYEYLRISHDGRRVAVDEANQRGDIWVWTFASENGVRLTTGDQSELYPVWTADDSRIAFAFGAGAARDRTVYWKASSNTGTIEALTPQMGTGAQGVTPYFFTPDDTALVFRDQFVAGAGDNIGMIALDGDANAEPVWLLASEFEERNAELSPDGHWMAYQSNESGRFEVYVRPFPAIEDDLFTISTAGGTKPVWSPGGDELFYLEPGNPQRMMAVEITIGETFTHQLPEPLIDWPYDRGNEGRTFDIAPDGARFLTTMAVDDETGEDDEPAPQPQLRIVLNWFTELRERVPVD